MKHILIFPFVFSVILSGSIHAQNPDKKINQQLLGDWVSVMRIMDGDSLNYSTEIFSFLEGGKLKARDENAPIKSAQEVEGTWEYFEKENRLFVVFLVQQMKDTENMSVDLIYNAILKLTIKRNKRTMTRIMVRKGSGLEAKAVKKILTCVDSEISD